MARRKPQPDPEPEYFRHNGMPQLGPCVVVRQSGSQTTYLFADGKQRTFRDAWLHFVEEHAPSDEDRLRLKRGLVGGSAATPKAVHVDLEAQIRARPRDVEPYLVYADWLQNREDPRGELIAIHHQLRESPTTKLRAAERELLRAHGDYLLPALLLPLLPARPVADPRSRSEVTWHMGFLERVRLARKREGEEAMTEIVAGVLEHPSAQFLRSLVLGPLGGANAKYAEVIDAVVRRERPFLEELVIGDVDPLDIPFVTTGDLVPIVGALPRLRRFEVRTATLRLNAILHHPVLEELVVVTTSLSEATLTRLVKGKLPELATLDLTCEGMRVQRELLEPLLAATGVPKLRNLAIRGSRGTRDLLDAILGSQLGAQLESVTLERGDLDDRDLALLVHARRDAFARLGALDLSANRVTEAGHARLREVVPTRAAPPSTIAPEITASDVAELAPDRESIIAAKTVARPARWQSIGRDAERVWGQYNGSRLYFVSTRFDGSKPACTCASYKDPCKHVLGLLLIVAAGHPIAERPVPPSVKRNTPDRPK